MPNLDADDEEDWDEDWSEDESYDDEESAPCPECGATIHSVLDKCPQCGYWLTDEDRRNLWSGARKPPWLMATAWIVLAVFIVPLIALVLVLLKQLPSRDR